MAGNVSDNCVIERVDAAAGFIQIEPDSSGEQVYLRTFENHLAPCSGAGMSLGHIDDLVGAIRRAMRPTKRADRNTRIERVGAYGYIEVERTLGGVLVRAFEDYKQPRSAVPLTTQEAGRLLVALRLVRRRVVRAENDF